MLEERIQELDQSILQLIIAINQLRNIVPEVPTAIAAQAVVKAPIDPKPLAQEAPKSEPAKPAKEKKAKNTKPIPTSEPGLFELPSKEEVSEPSAPAKAAPATVVVTEEDVRNAAREYMLSLPDDGQRTAQAKMILSTQFKANKIADLKENQYGAAVQAFKTNTRANTEL